MKLLKKIIALCIILFPVFVLAEPVESEISSTSGIIKEFDVGHISIENVGYTRFSNLLSSGEPGVIIKGIIYNEYARDVQLDVILRLYDNKKNLLEEFNSVVDIDSEGKSTYQEVIYAKDIDYILDDIKYFSLIVELDTDVQILEKAENDVYYLEDYYIKVKVNSNNVYNVEESFLATFRNKIVEIESGIPYRLVYTREDGTKISKRAIISNIEVDQYYKLSTIKGVRTLLIGKLDKTNTKKNYNIKYDYNVGDDILDNEDEFVFYLISNYDVKVDGVSFQIEMPKNFREDKIKFIDNNGLEIDNVSYQVNGNVIDGRINGLINPEMSYAIKISLEDNYFTNTSTNISKWLIISIVVPIILVIVTIFVWFIEKSQKKCLYKGNILFNKNINSLELGYLYNGEIRDHDIASILFCLANKGYLEIQKDKKNYKICKLKDYDGNDRVEKNFMKELFDDGDIITRKDLSISLYSIKEILSNKLDDQNRKKKIYSESILTRRILYWFMIVIIIIINNINMLIEFQPSALIFNIILSIVGYTILLNSLVKKKNVMEKMIYTLVAVILIVIPIVLTSYQAFLVDIVYDIVYIVGIVCILVIMSVSSLMSDRTRYGRNIYYKINSYKEYLLSLDSKVVDKELKNDKYVLYELLPYVFVLGISDKVLDKFRDKVNYGPIWYKDKTFKLNEFYSDFKNIYSDIFIALKSSGSNLNK